MNHSNVSAVFRTPFGWAGVAVSQSGVRRIILPRKSKPVVQRELRAEGIVPDRAQGAGRSNADRLLNRAVRLLQRYFSGETVAFDLPLDLRYYTPFQQSVWQAAAAIRFGETRSYGWIATRIGRPLAARAVGQAMGANPVPVLVP